jgi:hypothetical protein
MEISHLSFVLLLRVWMSSTLNFYVHICTSAANSDMAACHRDWLLWDFFKRRCAMKTGWREYT